MDNLPLYDTKAMGAEIAVRQSREMQALLSQLVTDIKELKSMVAELKSVPETKKKKKDKE